MESTLSPYADLREMTPSVETSALAHFPLGILLVNKVSTSLRRMHLLISCVIHKFITGKRVRIIKAKRNQKKRQFWAHLEFLPAITLLTS